MWCGDKTKISNHQGNEIWMLTHSSEQSHCGLMNFQYYSTDTYTSVCTTLWYGTLWYSFPIPSNVLSTQAFLHAELLGEQELLANVKTVTKQLFSYLFMPQNVSLVYLFINLLRQMMHRPWTESLPTKKQWKNEAVLLFIFLNHGFLQKYKHKLLSETLWIFISSFNLCENATACVRLNQRENGVICHKSWQRTTVSCLQCFHFGSGWAALDYFNFNQTTVCYCTECLLFLISVPIQNNDQFAIAHVIPHGKC